MIDATAKANGGRGLLCLSLAFSLLLAGCAHDHELARDWQTVAKHKDVEGLRKWRSSWVSALDAARAKGNGAAIAAEGALLDPDAGLNDPTPPAGDYHCRVIRFGTGDGTTSGFAKLPAVRCRLDDLGDGLLDFAMLEGTQRPIGRIYPGRGARLTFLGTLELGDESRPFAYGLDAQRDLIGFVERIGPQRWRLDIPHPPFNGASQVIELIPDQA